ncbi:ABC transporter ATP-binding protein [Neobacillus sp. 114]|uniref:ABC transporter ATP-binding protein n=1 Tax=Neobacillus sp. 114 TaxID=3048535 RepID=UPI0024C27192|nr:ABC transporter ATP-binding protein [Neobacillus sp. 114]
MILDIRNVTAGYSKKTVIEDVSLNINEGEIVGLIGHNGAGKSTLLSTIHGQIKPSSGNIYFREEKISGLRPEEIVKKGLSYIPQGHQVFKSLTVLDNLKMGCYFLRNKKEIYEKLEVSYKLFPILKEREKQKAGTMSGGQQQMLAVAMGLMTSPKLLLIDEPSIGLAPSFVQTVMDAICEINKTLGTSILIVEQNIDHLFRIANRVYGLRRGKIVAHDDSETFTQNYNLLEIM